jgi:hypothetical protein
VPDELVQRCVVWPKGEGLVSRREGKGRKAEGRTDFMAALISSERERLLMVEG